MPVKAKRMCKKLGCSTLVDSGYCPIHTPESKKKIKKDYSGWYGLSQWKILRLCTLQENPFCIECNHQARIVRANIVDHIKPHRGDWSTFWDKANLQCLCKSCHDRKTSKEDGGFGNRIIFKPKLNRSICPLTVICGPSGSGKTTYVESHKEKNDIVIDLDEIKSRLSGLPWYEAGDEWLGLAIDERNKMLESLSTNKYNHAWYIVTAPKQEDRAFWQQQLQPYQTIILLTHINICKDRIINDTKRKGKEQKYVNLAEKWWKDYTIGQNEVYISF